MNSLQLITLLGNFRSQIPYMDLLIVDESLNDVSNEVSSSKASLLQLSIAPSKEKVSFIAISKHR